MASTHDSEGEWGPGSLRRSLRLITLTACLSMIYSTAVTSPATTQYFQDLGASEFHFSLLAGIPLIMLSLQFLGAMLTNRLARRRPVFLVLNILGRLMYIPVAFLPMWGPLGESRYLLPVMIGLLAVGSACTNLIVPMWLAWVGDVIPRRRLSTFWGQRHAWMHATWTVCYVLITVFLYVADLPVQRIFRILITIGVLAGVLDVVLYLWVREPVPVQSPVHRAPVWSQLLEPLRHKEFRSFVGYSCWWQMSVMWAAAFMQVYVIRVLEIPVWKVSMIWCSAGLGAMLASRTVGRLADRHGNRPLLVISVSMKSMITIVFMLMTRETVVWVLPVAFMFDSILNAGLIVAGNGYMLRHAPLHNRAMFVAAITGLSGIFGGLGALASGAFLEAIADVRWHLLGREWNHYQVMFAMGVLLRWSCILLVRRIKEPTSSNSFEVLHELGNIWPFQVFLFPLEFGRRFLRKWDESHRELHE